MLVRLTNALRARMADALMGDAPAAQPPATARVGYAAAGRGPTEAMYDPAPTQATLTATRDAQHQVALMVTIPAGSNLAFDEVGVYDAGGTLLLHATMPTMTVSAGAEGGIELTFNPEVYSV